MYTLAGDMSGRRRSLGLGRRGCWCRSALTSRLVRGNLFASMPGRRGRGCSPTALPPIRSAPTALPPIRSAPTALPPIRSLTGKRTTACPGGLPTRIGACTGRIRWPSARHELLLKISCRAEFKKHTTSKGQDKNPKGNGQCSFIVYTIILRIHEFRVPVCS